MINQLLYNKIINLHFIIFRRIIKQFDPDNKELLKKIQEADESTFSIRGNDVVKSKSLKTAYASYADDERRKFDERRKIESLPRMNRKEKEALTLDLRQKWNGNVAIQVPYKIAVATAQLKAAEDLMLKYIYTDENGLEGKLNNYSFEVVN